MVTFKDVAPADLVKVLDFLSGDGHTVWKAEALAELLP